MNKFAVNQYKTVKVNSSQRRSNGFALLMTTLDESKSKASAVASGHGIISTLRLLPLTEASTYHLKVLIAKFKPSGRTVSNQNPTTDQEIVTCTPTQRVTFAYSSIVPRVSPRKCGTAGPGTATEELEPPFPAMHVVSERKVQAWNNECFVWIDPYQQPFTHQLKRDEPCRHRQ